MRGNMYNKRTKIQQLWHRMNTIIYNIKYDASHKGQNLASTMRTMHN